MMLRSPRRLWRACGGTTPIEFALVAPLFLALIFGCIEYGRLLWTEQALQETAMAAARCMAILQTACATSGNYYSASNTQSYVQTLGDQWGVTIPSSGITLTPNTTCGGVTGFSQVSIASTFTSPVSAFVHISASGISLTATACFPNNP